MRKVVIFIFVLFLLIIGCSSEAISDYKKAELKTQKIQKGRTKLNITLDTTFIIEGLSAQEVNDLSYYDHVTMSMDIQFDATGEKLKVISSNYYNFGGMTLDSVYYQDGNKKIVKVPNLGGYINLGQQSPLVKDQELREQEPINKILQPFQEEWHSSLSQEDVVQGKKVTILTEEGPIKTMTYTLDASEEELKALGEILIKSLESEDLIDKILAQSDPAEQLDKDLFITNVRKAIDKMSLLDFDGMAYVDSDGRIVKENYDLSAAVKGTMVGELSSFVLKFEIDHLQMNEKQTFDFPVVKEDEWIKNDLQIND
ncbi:MAG: hypothetical protein H7X94_06100 [Vallitaleaceae bacterium]|nr:hypothetical protein [Vallitaleaceae bacterium]